MKALTFKEKQEVLKEIFQEYHRIKFQLECLENKNFYPSIGYGIVKEEHLSYQNKDKQLNHYIESKDDLNNILESYHIVINKLSSESKNIIINEFVLERENDWWMEYYSRSTYYRLKTRAMEEALFYFNCL